MNYSANYNKIKSEQVCRTCLIDEGHFFNISDTFDHYTLTQMIQNITNLQIHPADGYTQSICEQCIQKLREAHTFRIQCLESYNTLTTLDPVSVCEAEFPIIEEVKKEINEICDSIDDDDDDDDNNIEIENYCKSEDQDLCDDYDDDGQGQDIDNDNDNEQFSSNNDEIIIIFDCPLCHGLFSKNNLYQKHIKHFHPDKLDDDCFKIMREPLGHVLKNNGKKIFKCLLDEFFGDTFAEFKNHMKEHMGEKPVVCIKCGFRTTEMSLLKKHLHQKHTEEKNISCQLCDYSCKTQHALKCHLAVHSDEKTYHCQLCPMSFKRQTDLWKHTKKFHENLRPNVCGICHKGFFESRRLKDHMLIHSGDRPHICHQCGKTFTTESNMKSHIALQHEPIKRLFNCEICEYSSKTKLLLKVHMMRHSGEKPFKCIQCPFSSTTKYRLQQHITRLHSGGYVKNFACDLCDYKAVSPAMIRKHRTIHTGEKPYSCTLCNYSGRTNVQLKRHLETHNTEQNFECPFCPYKTNAKRYLMNHLKKQCMKRGRPSTSLLIPNNDNIKND